MTVAVDKSSERVRQMFGQIAPRYDRLNHILSLNIDRWWRRTTVARLRPREGDQILDVCSGTGDLAFAFWRRTRGRAQIVASDFCPEMLAVGREKQQRRNIAEDQLRFVEADALALPFSDNSFDIVTVAFGLRNVADTSAGLAEMVRVCRSGGRVAILEFSTPRRQPMKSLYGWYFRNVLPRIGQRLNRNQADAYEYLPQSVGEFPSYEQLAELMRTVGLRAVRFRPLTFGVATLYTGER